MSRKSNKPEWHDPAAETNIPLDETIEVGEVEVGVVVLADGPLDPVPLSTSPRDIQKYTPPRHLAGPMPSFETKDTMEDTLTSKSSGPLEVVKSVAGNAGAVTKSALGTAATTTKSALGTAATTVGTASATGAKTVGGTLWDIAQRNPLQAILLIASLIWLVRNNKATASQPPVSLPEVGDKIGAAAGQVQGAAVNAAGQVQGAAVNVASQMQGAAVNLSSQIGEQAQRGAGWFQDTLQSNPLALGAMAVVLGAAVGLAVPETAPEHKLMGETRDKLAGQVQVAAQDLTQKVTTVAQTAVHEAVESVKTEAKNQGLAPQDVAQKVTEVAQTATQEAIKSVKSEAKNQGLTSE